MPLSKNQSYVQTAGKSDLSLKSDLKDAVSTLFFASDQIIGFLGPDITCILYPHWLLW